MASISGSLPTTNIVLDGKVKIDDLQEIVEVSVSGLLQGTVTYNRSNALLCDLVTEYICIAKIKAGEMQWYMHITMQHSIASSKVVTH